jgi:hypothetical protein
MLQQKAEQLGYVFDKLPRAINLLTNGKCELHQADENAVKGTAKANAEREYAFVVDFNDNEKTTCSCGYYLAAKNGGVVNRFRLCTHQIAGLISADNGAIVIVPTSTPRKQRTPKATNAAGGSPTHYSQAFTAKMSRSIGSAITETAESCLELIKAGFHPIMVGPTGCGKTSASKIVRRLVSAWKNRPVGFETISGLETYGDADLFGLITVEGRIKSIIARGFERARNGELVIMFIDELLRFDKRVQNSFMEAVLPISAEDARAMGIDTDVPVYRTEAPQWGVEVAPAENIIWIFGTNPWGSTIDAAFARRVDAHFVSYSEDVLKHITDQSLVDFVKLTWELNQAGTLKLPVEYQQLASMKNGSDRTFLTRYMNKLKFADMNEYSIVSSFLPQTSAVKEPAVQ